MNGVNVGTTQYIDAFERAEFWSLVQGTPYHLILNRTTLSSVALSFSPTGSPGTNYPASEFGGCATGFVGVVNFTNMDNMIQALITGPLAPMVNAGIFPIFLTQDVVLADPGHSIFANCCILGYHGAFFDPSLQIYSPFAIDTANVFGAPDVQILSHEMGEAINDPNGVNPTPLWGVLDSSRAARTTLRLATRSLLAVLRPGRRRLSSAGIICRSWRSLAGSMVVLRWAQAASFQTTVRLGATRNYRARPAGRTETS